MRAPGRAGWVLLVVAVVLGGCQDDPAGVVPSTALAPVTPGLDAVSGTMAALAPVVGGTASAGGSAADASMAESLATALLASLEGGNSGSVAALARLVGSDSHPAAGRAKSAPDHVHAPLPAGAFASLGRSVANATAAPRVPARPRARKPRARRPSSQWDGGLVTGVGAAPVAPAVSSPSGRFIPPPKPLPDGWPPERPGTGLPPPVFGPGHGEGPEPWVHGRPLPMPAQYTGTFGGTANTGETPGVLAGWSSPGSDQQEPAPGAERRSPGSPGEKPRDDWHPPAWLPGLDASGDVNGSGSSDDPIDSGGLTDGTRPPGPGAPRTRLTTLPDGFRIQDGPTDLTVRGARLTLDARGRPARIDIPGPVRAAGTVTGDSGPVNLQLGIAGITGTIEFIASGEPPADRLEPRFSLMLAPGGVSVEGRIDRIELRAAAFGLNARVHSVADLEKHLRGLELRVELSVRNFGDQLASAEAQAWVRNVRFPREDGPPAADALWGRAKLVFALTSEPYRTEGVQTLGVEVAEPDAVRFSPEGEPRHGRARLDIAYRDGRRGSLAATLREGELTLDGEMSTAGGGRDRVESTAPGRVRVAGEVLLSGGGRERHEVEIERARGQRPVRVVSRVVDSRGADVAEFDIRPGENATAEGSWRDLAPGAARRGRFTLDTTGVVRLQTDSGAELATAKLPRRRAGD